MNTVYQRLVRLGQKLKENGLDKPSLDLEELKELTREEEESEENQRPLYDAEQTEIPGTWTEPSGELIKTSRD